jgi:hypothetical protein
MTRTTPKRTPTSFRLSASAETQLKLLAEWLGVHRQDVAERAITEMYQRESLVRLTATDRDSALITMQQMIAAFGIDASDDEE